MKIPSGDYWQHENLWQLPTCHVHYGTYGSWITKLRFAKLFHVISVKEGTFENNITQTRGGGLVVIVTHKA